MYLTGLGTATPERQYRQTECWDALVASPRFDQLARRSRAILEKVLLGDNGIQTRHLVLDKLSDAFEIGPDVLHERFVRHAPALAAEAARRALKDARCEPDAIDAVMVSTCTGYLCPGLSSYVIERLGLRSGVLALDLVGQGCGAALPNLRTGEALLKAGRAERALSICVEVCSAAFYLDDDPGVLVSACLFGDGAGAAVLAPEPPRFEQSQRRIRWLGACSSTDPRNRDVLRFEQRAGMLRNVLSRQVPGLAASAARELLNTSLANYGLRKDNITAWIWHAGGREVLLALQKELELDSSELNWSATVLSDFGNLSSCCVYHVLDRAVRQGAPDGYWWMSSFGAGFSCHAALLEVSSGEEPRP